MTAGEPRDRLQGLANLPLADRPLAELVECFGTWSLMRREPCPRCDTDLVEVVRRGGATERMEVVHDGGNFLMSTLATHPQECAQLR
jgi:hypothetical protein